MWRSKFEMPYSAVRICIHTFAVWGHFAIIHPRSSKPVGHITILELDIKLSWKGERAFPVFPMPSKPILLNSCICSATQSRVECLIVPISLCRIGLFEHGNEDRDLSVRSEGTGPCIPGIVLPYEITKAPGNSTRSSTFGGVLFALPLAKTNNRTIQLYPAVKRHNIVTDDWQPHE